MGIIWQLTILILYVRNFQSNMKHLMETALQKKLFWIKNSTRIHWLDRWIVRKTTRHHSHLSLCAKSRKTNDAKSRKWPKTKVWAIFWRFLGQISPNRKFFLKIRFHSNWRSYLVLTPGQKPKNSLVPFLRKISVPDFGLIWRPFREYLQIKNFKTKKQKG